MNSKKIFLICLVVLLSATILGCINKSPAEKIVNPNDITIKGQQMFVNGKPFFIKGVGYSPIPIGSDQKDYLTSKYTDIYNRDLPLLRKMGANTIRLWNWDKNADHTNFLDSAYNNGNDPIYVIVSFGISQNANISDLNTRKKLKSDFRKTVSKYKYNPAVLMWAVGNELNGYWKYDKKKLDDLFSLINEMAQEARLEEGDRHHPVTTSLVDANLTETIKTYDPQMTNLDVWSVQIYRGKSFNELFVEYRNASSKPLAILEYGIDSYDDRKHTEYQDKQAEYAVSLWKEAETNSDITIGASIMAYSDGWWKGKMGRGKENCPDYDSSLHSDCGYVIQGHPDGYANVEYWGIMSTKKNGSGPDIMEPKQVYYALQKLWANTSTTS